MACLDLLLLQPTLTNRATMAALGGFFECRFQRALEQRRLDPGIRPDTVFVPFHWGGAACVNALTSDALDPTSRMPEFKVCAVRVEAVEAR